MIYSVQDFAKFVGAWDTSETALYNRIHSSTACGAWISVIRDKESNVIGLTLGAFVDKHQSVRCNPLIFPFTEEKFSDALNYLESTVANAMAYMDTEQLNILTDPLARMVTEKMTLPFRDTEPGYCPIG